MSGFGKGSGPSAPPKSQPVFGNFPPPVLPSPPPEFPHFSGAPRLESPSQHEVRGRVQSHPMAFQSSVSMASFSPQSAGFDRVPLMTGRIRSPSLAVESTRSAVTAGYSHPLAGPKRPISLPPRSTEDPSPFIKAVGARSHPSPGIAPVATQQYSKRVVDEVAYLQTKRTRSPTYISGEENLSRNFVQPVIRRPVLTSPTSVSQTKLQNSYASSQGYPDQFSPVQSFDQKTNVLPEFSDVHATKRTKPLELQFATDFQPEQINLQRPFVSPLRSSPRSNGHEAVGSSKHTSSESAETKTVNFPVPKRTRSPPLPSSDNVSLGKYYSAQDDNERERLAKAKRLARFKVELGESSQSNTGSVDERDNMNKNEHSVLERNKYMLNQTRELSGNLANGNSLPDYEDQESSRKIVGLCPDMCPESERAERERKGDLDHYERLDGDRNQTSKFLAVKKYNRTAERESSLIRPMPILKKTIDYLLNLLSQPYDDKFLGIYNFLWDRMRAIRMDLRMQHIFNGDAITMLEQMIRLHIIAMHELCEFSKGEGFAEGFDAHLNIEQMNKTSVELFHMYDDHRKRGINVPSEKEFRGYYALLKLDKHPGYKVEPAELSLDLAKMTPEMRQTPEIKFARDVARACRTGNFIAFFRLARKASYLQACLMHAHFAKLRTQALASLHSGLQNNQGLPISHLSNWIGMEEEDIKELLEYHGFLIKIFEEPYMVREGPFLHGDKDYATKCSKLVEMKRSREIANDVSSYAQNEHLITGATKRNLLIRTDKEPKTSSLQKKSLVRTPSIEKETSFYEQGEVMTEVGNEFSPKDQKQVQSVIKTHIPIVSQFQEYSHGASAAFLPQFGPKPSKPLPTEDKFAGYQGYGALSMTSPARSPSTGIGVLIPTVSEASPQDIVLRSNDVAMESSEPQSLLNNAMEEEDLSASQENKNDIVVANYLDEEITNAKLKLILRLWRRQTSKKKLSREQRLLAANAALSTLSLGPPIKLVNSDKTRKVDEFDIDHALRERQKKWEVSWGILNVSDVVASTLSRKNLNVKCICWKLIVCSQINKKGYMDQRNQDLHFAASSWLHSKLMPSLKPDDLVVSSPTLSIWKNWVSCETADDFTCCLSIVKDVNFDDLSETMHGANSILFLITGSTPLDLQRVHLHKLLMSVPSGSCLPLLILSDVHDEEALSSSMLADKLGLFGIDKSKICSFRVISLLESPHFGHLNVFFSDKKLKEGLKWLANESPPQPILHCWKMLDLVTAHLNSSMEVLNFTRDEAVCPNNCISAFNLALDQSLLDITAAARENHSNWPCPEISLLESGDELSMLTRLLPPVGWSSEQKINPSKQALMDLKLPDFTDDMSWLAKGSNMGKAILAQREKLESCIISYLTQPCELMGPQLAMNEARVLLQKCVKLELRKLNYFIVPDWEMIFKRICIWRLRCLANRTFSCVYIADCHHVGSQTSPNWFERSELTSYHPYRPPLDEVIEAGCSTLSPLPEDSLAAMVSNDWPSEDATCAAGSMDDDNSDTRKIGFAESESADKELEDAGGVNMEAEKLSKLLDRCNVIQNAIDEKLYIYF